MFQFGRIKNFFSLSRIQNESLKSSFALISGVFAVDRDDNQRLAVQSLIVPIVRRNGTVSGESMIVLRKLAEENFSRLDVEKLLAELENMISNVVIIDKGKVVRYGALDGSMNSGSIPGEVEKVILGAIGEVSETMLRLLNDLPMVKSVQKFNRTVECQVASAEIYEFIVAVGNLHFPLAWLRRADRSAELEKLFLEVTAKGDL